MNLKSLCTILVTVTTQPPLGNYCPRKKKNGRERERRRGDGGRVQIDLVVVYSRPLFRRKRFFVLLSFKAKACESPSPIICPRGGTEKKIKGFQDVEHVGRGKGGLLSSPDLSRVFIVSL